MRAIRRCVGATLVAAATLGSASNAAAANWVTTWGTSIQPDANRKLTEQTVRNIVHISTGGKQVRVRITNAFGGSPAPEGDAWTDATALQVGSVYVGRQSGATAAVTQNTPVTFGGKATIRISPSTDVVSDPIALEVAAGENLAVSIYVKGTTPNASNHGNALQRSYMSAVNSGNRAADPAATGFANTTSWWFLDAVSVDAEPGIGAVVALGDSITDGSNSRSGLNHRWTDLLAARLATTGRIRGVVNEGIGGDSIIRDFNCCGGAPSGVARLDRDVLSHDGARTVIVALGVNDIGNYPTETVNVDEMTDGLRQIADKVHRHGMKILVATITPFGNATAAGYWNTEKEAKREAVNDFIRTAPYFDGVVDFATALADPANPIRMLAAYDSGDHLHPNDTGMQALANAVQWVDEPTLPIDVDARDVGGVVPATLALTLGAPPSFGALVPGVAREYTATLAATITSSAGDAVLTASDPSATAPGHLVNGGFALAQPLRVGGAPVETPVTLRTWSGPTSNESLPIALAQAITATEPLRTGSYAKTLVFTLSTMTP
jgi:lysophospholipase L1-like esterase